MNNLPITTSAPQTAAKPSQAAKPAQAANQFQAAPTAKPAQPMQAAKPAPADQAAKPAQAAQTAKPAQAAQATKPAPATQAAKTAEDGATQGQAFGDVLARQVSDAATAEDAEQSNNLTAKSADEALANLKAKTDADTGTALTCDINADLPSEMLATLIPKSKAKPQNASADTGNAQGTAIPPDASNLPGAVVPQGIVIPQGTAAATAADASALPNGRASSAGSAKDIPGMEQLALTQDKAVSGKTAPAHLAPQADSKKDAAFSSMMETITAATTAKLSDHDDKAAALAAAPQSNAAALASIQAATAPLAPTNAAPVQVSINTPVGNEKWGDEFNQKITWFSSQKEQTAELHLNPPQLGPMDVVLKVTGDQATALFTSPHAAVREAVEQAMPRLREMLAESGIMLGNATVSDQAPRNRQDDQDNKSSSSRSSSGAVGNSAAAGNMNVRVSPISRHNGIVDTFA